MPRNSAASHLSTPACISQVAAVCRNVCGLILPSSLANRTAVLNAVFTDWMGLPFHSTKCSREMPFAVQRRRCASRQGGIGTGGCRLVVRKLAVDWNLLPFGSAGDGRGRITVELTADELRAAPEYKEGRSVVILNGLHNLPVSD
jgi:hypothetical protein